MVCSPPFTQRRRTEIPQKIVIYWGLNESEFVTAGKNGRLFLSFLKLGLTAFGGPAMVAYIKEMAVASHKWLDDETFKNGVVLSQTVPGATAMQTAAYFG